MSQTKITQNNRTFGLLYGVSLHFQAFVWENDLEHSNPFVTKRIWVSKLLETTSNQFVMTQPSHRPEPSGDVPMEVGVLAVWGGTTGRGHFAGNRKG